MHKYECADCGARSMPFSTRRAAEPYWRGHCDEIHVAMTPINWQIVSDPVVMSQASDWKVFALLALLIVAALISKCLGG